MKGPGRRTALITGILGQDGTLLAERLLARGDRVVGVARPGAIARARDDPDRSLVARRCEIHELDIGSPELASLVAAVEPGETYHLAAVHHSSEGASGETPAVLGAMTAVNFNMAETLARTLAERGLESRLLVAASSQIWTPARLEHVVDETVAPNPTTFYGKTKTWAMQCLDHFRERFGVHASCAILFNHESHLRAPAFVTRKVCLHAARVARGERSRLRLANIGARVDWTAAQDSVAAMQAIASHERPGDFVVASGRARSIRDLLDAAFAAIGVAWQPHVDCDIDRPLPCLVGDSAKAHRILGWRPTIAFSEMVARMVERDLRRLDAAPDGGRSSTQS